jgi:hypothetical protein
MLLRVFCDGRRLADLVESDMGDSVSLFVLVLVAASVAQLEPRMNDEQFRSPTCVLQ